MIQAVNSIAGRLSLRPPQRESLRILARLTEIVPPQKGGDVAVALETVRSEFPDVTDFERDFPSVCFALATGVGKTRLMGAFIAYLREVHGMRHYFVLAPNLTIYDKLIREFTPGDPKYVFQGLHEFATNPAEIITGDNYESGRAVRNAQYDFDARDVHVNIFNISKINTEVRRGASPRIKRLHEYIGESYFEYLAGLDDLVLLMDESHRYRASAGVRALNELRPVLGLELTATPQVETRGRAQPFRNVIYSYPLAAAIRDGFVKEPAVAIRENFDAAAYDSEQLERIKLEDGVRIHENLKVDLETFSRQSGRQRVKPFLLVIARDVEHALRIRSLVESDAFFSGRYRGRVIDVHSRQGAEERDENVQRLLAVERVDEPTEIVIHVNMLKEGWDVTNLYTIVPLRPADSRTLVEQAIGRGLRLPYGRKVGVPALDRLTIVAHDRFQDIVDEANRPESPIRLQQVFVGRDIPEQLRRAVTVLPRAYAGAGDGTEAEGDGESDRFDAAIMQSIIGHEYLSGSAALRAPEVQRRIVSEAAGILATDQLELGEDERIERLRATVPHLIERVIERTIDIPRISIVPSGETRAGFTDFDLDASGISLQPVSQDILVQHLQSHQRHRLIRAEPALEVRRPEDYIVQPLLGRDDVDYAAHSSLIYKLAGQLMEHLRSYLDESGVLNVLQYHQRRLGDLVHAQLQQHWEVEASGGYEVTVTRGFAVLRPLHVSVSEEEPRDFRAPVDDPLYIRGLLFGGFTRCLYESQKFDSDTERRFAVVLEDDDDVLKWVKPAARTLQIHYNSDDAYEPDFVVETRDRKFLCEPKRDSEMDDPVVLAKARAAAQWCEHATAHELQHGGKRWSHLLIPGSEITAASTLGGLAASHIVRP